MKTQAMRGSVSVGSRLSGRSVLVAAILGGALLAPAAPAAPTVTVTSPHIFTGGSDGIYPQGLALGADGNVYGTTVLGGEYGGGTLFEVTVPGGFTVLQEFITHSYLLDTPLGANPGSLMQGNGNTLFGTDTARSFNGTGLDSGVWQNVFFFTTVAPYLTLSRCVFQNGARLSGWLVEDSANNIYGTAIGDPQVRGAGGGFVFKCGRGFTPVPAEGGGQFSIVYEFAGSPYGGGPEGGVPQGLTLGKDGNLYGVNQSGGIMGGGTVYKLTPGGSLTLLHAFLPQEGTDPIGALVQGRDGYYYGTTTQGGAYDYGTVFRIDDNGNFELLYAFTGGADGGDPVGLTLGSDGKLYGVTGRYPGTVFQLSSAGTPVTLYTFDGNSAVQGPVSPLVEASPGVFFGTTNGGTWGAVYRLSLN